MWIWFKKMMKNSYLEIEYLMTKIGDDTAEKKPPKKSEKCRPLEISRGPS